MKASFDGMRKNATKEMNRFGNVLHYVLETYGGEIAKSDMQKLIQRFNDAAQAVDVMNCLYDDSAEDDVNDLSYLSIIRIDELEEQ